MVIRVLIRFLCWLNGWVGGYWVRWVADLFVDRFVVWLVNWFGGWRAVGFYESVFYVYVACSCLCKALLVFRSVNSTQHAILRCRRSCSIGTAKEYMFRSQSLCAREKNSDNTVSRCFSQRAFILFLSRLVSWPKQHKWSGWLTHCPFKIHLVS